MENILSQGAEAKIIICDENTLEKIRDVKTYRHPLLDRKLRSFRVKREFKVLQKLYEKGVNVPKPYEINTKNMSFSFQYLQGNNLKDVLTPQLLEKAFLQIINLHQNGVIHGDLTTLNMIVLHHEIYLIDFGLSKFSKDIEERAVDLDLFFSCIKNQHPNLLHYKDRLLDIYEQELGEDVLARLRKVENRGRNKNK